MLLELLPLGWCPTCIDSSKLATGHHGFILGYFCWIFSLPFGIKRGFCRSLVTIFAGHTTNTTSSCGRHPICQDAVGRSEEGRSCRKGLQTCHLFNRKQSVWMDDSRWSWDALTNISIDNSILFCRLFSKTMTDHTSRDDILWYDLWVCLVSQS